MQYIGKVMQQLEPTALSRVRAALAPGRVATHGPSRRGRLRREQICGALPPGRRRRTGWRAVRLLLPYISAVCLGVKGVTHVVNRGFPRQRSMMPVNVCTGCLVVWIRYSMPHSIGLRGDAPLVSPYA